MGKVLAYHTADLYSIPSIQYSSTVLSRVILDGRDRNKTSKILTFISLKLLLALEKESLLPLS